MQILGVPINNAPKEKTLTIIERFLHEPRLHHIATVNPEFLVAAQKNNTFHTVLQNTDLNVPDGFGLCVGAKIAYFKSLLQKKSLAHTLKADHIYPGADLLWAILGSAQKNHCDIFLIANKHGLSSWQETAHAIKKTYPQLRINGIDLSPDAPASTIADSCAFDRPTVVFCNFGAPAQEIFLHTLKSARIGDIRLAMGVGGSFDYMTKNVPRAPRFMQKMGLEWLFRLMQQPWRIVRAMRAVIIFPLMVFLHDTDS